MLKKDYVDWVPFVGIVKEVEANRCRVRCFGIHPFDEEGQNSGAAQQAVSDGDLPWAVVGYPTDATAPTITLVPEDWVAGFFMDGHSAQQPFVTHKIGRGDPSLGTGFFTDGPSSSGFSGGGTGGAGGGGTPGNPGSGDSGGGGTSNDGAPVKANREMYYDNIPGTSNDQRAFNLYTTWLHEEQGMPLERAKEVSAGIIASLSGESGQNIDPGAYNPNDVGKPAEGIAQWRDDRQRTMWQMCGKNNGNLVCQLNYSISELENRGMGHGWEGRQPTAKKQLLSSSTAAEGTYAWTVFYEIPAEKRKKGRERYTQFMPAGRLKRLKDNYEPASIGGSRSKINPGNF